MSQMKETPDLESEIAALLRQAGERLRRQRDDRAAAAAAPPLQPARDEATQQESGQ
jgi:hypothetical protein